MSCLVASHFVLELAWTADGSHFNSMSKRSGAQPRLPRLKETSSLCLLSGADDDAVFILHYDSALGCLLFLYPELK